MGPSSLRPNPSQMSPRLAGREFDKFRDSTKQEGLSLVAIANDDGRNITSDTNGLLEQCLLELKRLNMALIVSGLVAPIADEQVA